MIRLLVATVTHPFSPHGLLRPAFEELCLRRLGRGA